MTRRGSGILLERRALFCAAAFGAVAIVLSCFYPHSIAIAWRLAVFSCFAPAMGCTLLSLVHRTTGGQWSAGIEPFLRAGVSLLPWIWVLAIPILFFAPFPGAGKGPGLPSGFGYDSFFSVAVRALAFGTIFFGLRRALGDGAGRQKDPVMNPRPWVGPVGLIILFFALTLLADDWLESLEPGWHSTGFAVVWICGQAVSGLSLCILGGLSAGNRPELKGGAGRVLGIDWGNLLLATMVFWVYVTFAHFLIIWAENLPEETSWYLRREQGAWGYVIPLLALSGFAVPFFLLLSRRLKASAGGLAWVAGLLLATQVAHLVWIILPSAGGSAGGNLLAFSLLAAALGVFVNRFAHAARLGRKEER